jgi:predicted negative regulator of RcsB-dependent stress response
MDEAISALDFIRTHSDNEGIVKISSYRLAHIYLEQDNMDKAHSVLSALNEDGYTQLQLALSISDPDERMDALNKALLLSDSAYLSNMIAIAQNDLI